jgi:hypothetical protein
MSTKEKLPPFIQQPLYKRIQALKDEAKRNDRPITHIKPINQSNALYEGVKTWCISMTPDQLKRRYSTIEVIQLAKLKGKYKDMPALQHVATALRKAGFEHKRSWTNASRNCRFWIYTGEVK